MGSSDLEIDWVDGLPVMKAFSSRDARSMSLLEKLTVVVSLDSKI